MNKNRLFIKIAVSVLIVVAIVVIWRFKTQPTPSAIPAVTAQNEEDFVLETASVDLEALTAYGLPIIIDFGSDSCIPCKEMAPVLAAMNQKMQGKAIIKFVDVWKHTDAADGFPIQVIPTQAFITASGTPYIPSEEMTIDFTMYSYKETGEHAFTVHQGGLTEEQMRIILADMGVNE